VPLLPPGSLDLDLDVLADTERLRYSEGFMLGAEGLTLYGWHHADAFGHLGMSNLLTWAEPSRDLVVAVLTTGKPMIGTHVLAFPRLIGAIHDAYPAHAA